MLLYTDDCLVISDRADKLLRNESGKHFEFEESSIGPPSKYLGGKLREVELDNGHTFWAYGSRQCVEAAVQNVVDFLKKREKSLIAKTPTPISSWYRPANDVTPEPLDNAAYYHSLVGVLRWTVELGTVDINVEGSKLSSHLVLPREGHA